MPLDFATLASASFLSREDRRAYLKAAVKDPPALQRINWRTLTREQAKRLIGPANRAEQAAAERFNRTGAEADERAMLAAFKLWEDLRVFVLCGERPE